MKTIILDTNFLLIPAQNKVDIFAEIHRIAEFSYILVIIDKSIDELKNIIKEQKGKHKAAAKLALHLIKQKGLKTISSKDMQGHVDDLIIKKASKNTIVATQDAILKKRLKTKNIPIITLRQKKYLVLQQ